MSEHIKAVRDGAVMTIRLARPEKKNAITTAMYTAMAEAMETAESDDTIRVIVFLGSGGAFAAGNDLKDFLENPPQEESAPVFRFLNALLNATKPIVAGVEGVAVGLGTTLLLHCDLVYVTANARLQTPFVNLGLTPEAGATYLLPRFLGHVRAAEMVMLGEPMDGETAVRLGLANALLAPEELEDKVLSTARALAEKPPAALRATRALLKANHPQVEAAMNAEAAEFTARLRSAEAKEAFSAFLEKRKPDFSKT
jgi:enoyl-CoA hydratase/carnithine racemase